MFVTFEGLDLSGKTTQAQLLVERLSSFHARDPHVYPPVLFLREPGGTPISERLRGILLDRGHDAMSDRTELLLFAASRAQLVAEVIRPALERNEIVLSDRFHDSTTAYQAYGRGLELEVVRAINRFATAGVIPDLTIFVDIPVEDIERRRLGAGTGRDRMESSGVAFYERVRAGYHAMCAAEPQRFVCVNGTSSVQAVAQEVWRAFLERAPLFRQ